MNWSVNEPQYYERVSVHEPGASWGLLKPTGASWGLQEPLGTSWDLLGRFRASGGAQPIATDVHKTLRIRATGEGQSIGTRVKHQGLVPQERPNT